MHAKNLKGSWKSKAERALLKAKRKSKPERVSKEERIAKITFKQVILMALIGVIANGIGGATTISVAWINTTYSHKQSEIAKSTAPGSGEASDDFLKKHKEDEIALFTHGKERTGEYFRHNRKFLSEFREEIERFSDTALPETQQFLKEIKQAVNTAIEVYEIAERNFNEHAQQSFEDIRNGNGKSAALHRRAANAEVQRADEESQKVKKIAQSPQLKKLVAARKNNFKTSVSNKADFAGKTGQDKTELSSKDSSELRPANGVGLQAPREEKLTKGVWRKYDKDIKERTPFGKSAPH